MSEALLVFGTSPMQLGLAPAGTAKVARAMLDAGWGMDILGFRADRNSPNDPFFTELLAKARVHETASLFGKPSTWAPGAALAGRRLMRQRGHGLLVSFAGIPWAHVTAFLIARRRAVPWVAFYTDPWSNHTMAKMSPLRRRVEHAIERRALARADAVVFTNGHLQDWVIAAFPERGRIAPKCVVIPYFFEPELYPPARPRASDGTILVRHMGNTPPGGYGPALLEALRLLKAEMPALWQRLRVEFYGSVRSWFRDEVERCGLTDRVHFLPGVSYRDSLRLMREADLLLLLAVTPRDYGGLGNSVLYLKLVDYIGAGRPVFALAGEDSTVSDVLRSTGGVCSAEDPAAIKKAFVEFLSSPTALDPEARRQFSRGAVYPRWTRVFEAVTAGRRGRP